jgi:hypothetical protein
MQLVAEQPHYQVHALLTLLSRSQPNSCIMLDN